MGLFTDDRPRMAELARTFPTLASVPGAAPFVPEVLDRWAAEGQAGRGALWAARFLLQLWNQDHEWAAGPFDIVRALAAWDASHRAAFLAWAAAPWWP